MHMSIIYQWTLEVGRMFPIAAMFARYFFSDTELGYAEIPAFMVEGVTLL